MERRNEVNQWLNPLKCGTGSNLVDAGRAAVRALTYRTREATPKPAFDAGGEAIGEGLRRTRWRGCSGKAGRRSDRPGHGERGNRPGVALPGRQPGWSAGRPTVG